MKQSASLDMELKNKSLKDVARTFGRRRKAGLDRPRFGGGGMRHDEKEEHLMKFTLQCLQSLHPWEKCEDF